MDANDDWNGLETKVTPPLSSGKINKTSHTATTDFNCQTKLNAFTI